MRHPRTAVGFSIAVAFVAGILVVPFTHWTMSRAHAAAAPLTAQMVDLAALTHDDLPKTAYPEQHSKPLVVTDNTTIAVQSGNVGKHIHPKTDEIQYIIEGTGSMWLGNERKDFKPGTLIIIPKGTAHMGMIVSSGPVKALAIKIPPQPPDDTVFVN